MSKFIYKGMTNKSDTVFLLNYLILIQLITLFN